MFGQNVPVCASIDVGSNTIHLVVARCTPDDLDILADEFEVVRIGESVTATGAISPQKCAEAVAVLQRYCAVAAHHEANPVLVVATEAIRKAHNSDAFLATVERETGLHVVLIDGNVEATLTFAGATYTLRKEPHAPTAMAVMDLGGGSMELVTAHGAHITWRTSLPLGSGWLHDRYLPTNPPTQEERELARTFLTTFVQGIHLQHEPSALIVTGGSANSLLLLAHAAFGGDLASERLSYDELLRCEGLLYALPAEEVAQRYHQPLGRALLLPAGAAIIRTMMTHLGLDEIRVSPHGIREGALLAYVRYGDAWLERVSEEAQAEQETADNSKLVSEEKQSDERTFAHVGRSQMREQMHKLLSWREHVLRNDDVEAVHKMRVATRRLRAVLDAYAPICEPKALKKVLQQVKGIADALGNARDTDVMIQHMQEQLQQAASEAQPGLHWLITRLQIYRDQQQDVLESLLRPLDPDSLLRLLEECVPEGGVDGKS
jgi:exopolyphosphatase/pppGpp-phosphohydrolase